MATLGEVFLKNLDDMYNQKRISKEEYKRIKKAYLGLTTDDETDNK